MHFESISKLDNALSASGFGLTTASLLTTSHKSLYWSRFQSAFKQEEEKLLDAHCKAAFVWEVGGEEVSFLLHADFQVKCKQRGKELLYFHRVSHAPCFQFHKTHCEYVSHAYNAFRQQSFREVSILSFLDNSDSSSLTRTHEMVIWLELKCSVKLF